MTQFYLPPTGLSTNGMSHTCLYSPAAEHHCTLAGTHFQTTPGVLQKNWLNRKWILSEFLCPTRHKTGHFRDVLSSQSLGIVLKKLNLAQQKQTRTNKPEDTAMLTQNKHENWSQVWSPLTISSILTASQRRWAKTTKSVFAHVTMMSNLLATTCASYSSEQIVTGVLLLFSADCKYSHKLLDFSTWKIFTCVSRITNWQQIITSN